MNEFRNSITAWLRERTSSPLYGTYIMSFIVWNWKVFYTLFWQDQSVLSVPKIDYIQSHFLFENDILHIVYNLAPPLIATYLIIRWAPFVNIWAHKVSTDFHFQQKVIYDTAKVSYEEKRKKGLEKLAEIKQEQAISVKEIRESMTEEDRWLAEYKEFKNAPKFNEFRGILEAIYKSNGYINMQEIDTDLLVLVHVMGLISFTDFNKNQLDLTEKGRFFAKKYLGSVKTK